MFVIKYLLDEINPYVIRGELRTNSKELATKFKDKSEARRIATQFGYAINEIEIVEI